MACVSADEKHVSVSCRTQTYILQLCDSELSIIDHPKANFDNIVSSNNSGGLNRLHVEGDDLGLGLLCSAISPCGNLLAFCTYTKNLCVVNISKCKGSIDVSYSLPRGASKVKFTPISKNLIVSDKSGDIYLFRPQNKSDKGELILGHLSLLLDVLVTSDEQFIITCDRDEKIRVSSFPNGYNIITYCLGHSEFVSSILLLPHQNNCLVSTSGDGTVRFWDYMCGDELMICNMSYFINGINEQSEDLMAITDVAALLVNNSTSFICVCLYHLKMCMVLKCTSEDEKLHYNISQTITLDTLSPWRVTISSNILWMVLNSDDNVTMKAMTFNAHSHTFEDVWTDNVGKAVKTFNNQKLITDCQHKIVDLLFKRKFDNVEDYLKKKDAKFVSLETSRPIKRSKQ